MQLFVLTEEEIQALLHGWDKYFPSDSDRYKINTDFHQNILNISDLSKHHLDNVKTKLRSPCIKYDNSKTLN